MTDVLVIDPEYLVGMTLATSPQAGVLVLYDPDLLQTRQLLLLLRLLVCVLVVAVTYNYVHILTISSLMF